MIPCDSGLCIWVEPPCHLEQREPMSVLDRLRPQPLPDADAAAPDRSAPTFHPAFHKVPFDGACPHCRGERGTAQRQAGPSDWSFVDVAYCISLRDRPDRMALAAAELHRTGLCQKTVFHRPERHPSLVIAGIWEAHRVVALHALGRGAHTALVLEDDVLFRRRITPERLARVRRAMARLPQGWMIFFLGHWPLRARFVAADTLATRSACAHAYIASRRLLRWLEAHPFERRGRAYDKRAGGGIDAAFAALDRTYAYFPMLAIQAVRGSDHMAAKKATRPVRKLRHLVTRTGLGELLLSRLMRTNELVVAAAGAVAGAAEWLRGRRHVA
jgi:hypothetical protein